VHEPDKESKLESQAHQGCKYVSEMRKKITNSQVLCLNINYDRSVQGCGIQLATSDVSLVQG